MKMMSITKKFKEKNMKINKIFCPCCNKELIALEPAKRNSVSFWCDNCNIDIDVKLNKESTNE